METTPKLMDFSFLAIVDDKEAERLEAEEAERLAKIKERELREYFRTQSGTPARYLDCTLKNYTAETDKQKKALEICARFANNPADKSLVLCGTNGVGKTHLAAGILRGIKGIYSTLLGILYRLESSASYKSTETKMQTLNAYCRAPLLVIDEVGRGETEGQKERQAEVLYYILNERYGACLPTVICTNMDKVSLVRYMGEAVRDRLNDTCIFCEIDGTSHRGRRERT